MDFPPEFFYIKKEACLLAQTGSRCQGLVGRCSVLVHHAPRTARVSHGFGEPLLEEALHVLADGAFAPCSVLHDHLDTERAMELKTTEKHPFPAPFLELLLPDTGLLFHVSAR